MNPAHHTARQVDSNCKCLSHIESLNMNFRAAGPFFAAKRTQITIYVSLKLAKPNDFWFHVRGMPGSHVILTHQDKKEPDREMLKKAAAVAAWYSKARHGGVVAVSCTKARFVTKPRGAKPGLVHIRKESTLKVRPALP